MKKIFAALSLFGLMVIAPSYASAQSNVNLFEDVCKKNGNQSSVCKDAKLEKDRNGNNNPLYGPRGIITVIVRLLSVVIGIAAVVGIIVAGIKYATSGSNSEEANKARELIIYAVVGLFIAAIAQVIIRAVLYKIDL